MRQGATGKGQGALGLGAWGMGHGAWREGQCVAELQTFQSSCPKPKTKTQDPKP